jgi:hypothetical protein
MPITQHADRSGWIRVSFSIRESPMWFDRLSDLARIRGERGRMNIEKQRSYRKASARALYTITICIDTIDGDFTSETATAKEVWDQLYAKYSRIRPQANRDDVKKITAFQLPKDTKIEDAWASLKTTRARVVAANSDFRQAFTEGLLFEQLLSGLPDEYSTVRANIDAQPHFASPHLPLLLGT